MGEAVCGRARADAVAAIPFWIDSSDLCVSVKVWGAISFGRKGLVTDEDPDADLAK
jgi:hypothetical protein